MKTVISTTLQISFAKIRQFLLLPQNYIERFVLSRPSLACHEKKAWVPTIIFDLYVMQCFNNCFKSSLALSAVKERGIHLNKANPFELIDIQAKNSIL